MAMRQVMRRPGIESAAALRRHESIALTAVEMPLPDVPGAIPGGFQLGHLRVARGGELAGRNAVQLVELAGDVGSHALSVPRSIGLGSTRNEWAGKDDPGPSSVARDLT